MSNCFVDRPSTGRLTLSKVLEARRDFVSEQLQNVCLRHVRPTILSVGQGKLREAAAVLPLCHESGGEFVVLNGSAETLDLLREEYGARSARCIRDFDWFSPVKEAVGEFHYIYGLNFLNQLEESRARRVVKSLAASLRPGGSLLISNFTREMEDLLWPEPLDGRTTVYRDEADMSALLAQVPDRTITGHAIWRDDPGTLVYLEIHK